MIESPVSIMLRCFMLVFPIVSRPLLAVAFQWKSDEVLHVSGCVGSRLSLPWHYVTQAGETTSMVTWYQGDQCAIASFSKGRFQASGQNRSLLAAADANAGLTFDPARLQDNGYYQVRVTVRASSGQAKDKVGEGNDTEEVDKTVFVASAFLTVAQPAVTVNDSVHVQEVTSDDSYSDQPQLTLSRGVFSSRGYPPVDVVWKDPAGQIMPSSRFHDGYFYLDLPRHALPGNYTSHVTLPPPMRQCLPADSPLLSNLQTHVGTGQCGVEVKSVKVEEMGGDFEAFLVNVTDLQTSVGVLQQRLDTVADASTQVLLVDLVRRYGEDLASLASRVSAIDSRFLNETESLNSQLKTTETTVIALRSKDVAMETKLQELRSVDRNTASVLQGLSDELSSTYQNLTQDISAVRATVTGLQSQMTGYGYTAAPKDQCPQGWQASGASCYTFQSSQVSWDDAQGFCNATWNATLVTIYGESENSFVKRLAAGVYSVWMGLTDKQKEGNWSWVDSPHLPYSNWAPTEPNNKDRNEHCAELYSGTGRWNDEACSSRRQFVCKKRA